MIIPTMVRHGYAKIFDVRFVSFRGQTHLSPYSQWHEMDGDAINSHHRPIRALCMEFIPASADFAGGEEECQVCRCRAKEQHKVVMEDLWKEGR